MELMSWMPMLRIESQDMPMKAHLLKREMGNLKGKRITSPTTRTPQGISQPRQGQSKQKDVALARQMTPT